MYPSMKIGRKSSRKGYQFFLKSGKQTKTPIHPVINSIQKIHPRSHNSQSHSCTFDCLFLLGVRRNIFHHTRLGIETRLFDLSQLFLGHGLECCGGLVGIECLNGLLQIFVFIFRLAFFIFQPPFLAFQGFVAFGGGHFLLQLQRFGSLAFEGLSFGKGFDLIVDTRAYQSTGTFLRSGLPTPSRSVAALGDAVRMRRWRQGQFHHIVCQNGRLFHGNREFSRCSIVGSSGGRTHGSWQRQGDFVAKTKDAHKKKKYTYNTMSSKRKQPSHRGMKFCSKRLLSVAPGGGVWQSTVYRETHTSTFRGTHTSSFCGSSVAYFFF
eukprot:scaffold1555_cov173-Amphora_coffeaeformis.AAC.8